MSAQQRLIRLLADGQLHSGSELADVLGVSRTAVWKQLGQLDSLGLELSAQAGQGYQLAAPLELLDPVLTYAGMEDATRQLCATPEVLWSSISTSTHLLGQSPPEPGNARACLAEFQTAGRGRRGRPWFAPVGHGICLSVDWRFGSSPTGLSCLGLAVGVGVLRALQKAGLNKARLKWPNDIVVEGHKLAGILIDVQGEANGPLHVVAGVGVNYKLNSMMLDSVRANGGLEPASIQDDGGEGVAGRNQVAALLIDEICRIFRSFAEQGFAALVDEWVAADYLHGRVVNIVTDNDEITGTASGIADDGRLRVLTEDGRELLLVTGDVSVRAG